MHIILSSLYFGLFLSACQPTEPITPTIKEKKLKVVWKERIMPKDSSKTYISGVPGIYKDKLIYPAQDLIKASALVCRSTQNGSINWDWNDQQNRFIGFIRGICYLDNHCFFADGHSIYSINMSDGHYIKTPTPLLASSRTSAFFGILFHPEDDQSPGTEVSDLDYYNPLTLQKTGTWSLFRDSTYHPGIEPPVAEIAPNGDTLLYFIARYWNSAGQGRTDAFCLNYSKGSLMWQTKDITHKGNASVHAPLIVDDRIYIQGAFSIVCLNKQTGIVDWEYIPADGSGFGSTNLLFDADVIYAKPVQGNLLALDALNGKLMWKLEDKAGAVSNMVMYNGKIYYDTHNFGELVCINPAMRTMEWHYPSPNKERYDQAGFYDGIAIDESTGYLYATDRYYIVCIDLNKTK